MRDGVVFINERVIAVNVHGLTGKKKGCTSIPYNKISAYSIGTTGTVDLDAELERFISGVGKVRFQLKDKSKTLEISKYISRGVL
jgi:hypothetical protein